MARQQKQHRNCPRCKSFLKRTIGAASRIKYWVCTNESCDYKVKAKTS